MKNRAIIIGYPGRHTLGMLRSLGEKNVDVYLLIRGGKNNILQKSKYVFKSWVVDNSYEDMLNVIIENFPISTIKPVLFPGTDFDVAFVEKYFDLLKDRFICPSVKGRGEGLINLMDKNYVNRLAKEAGLNVPQSWIINTNHDNIEVPNDMIYIIFIH